MRLIIDIPEKEYENYKRLGDTRDILFESIRRGIPLPEGHGKLIVLSENKLKENQIDLDFSCQKWISEVGLSFATVAIIKAEDKN